MAASLVIKPEFRNLVSVATHELGHSMGLGHSEVSTAIMFPYYLSTWKRVQLDDDDIRGMQKLYGAAKPNKYLPPEPILPDIELPSQSFLYLVCSQFSLLTKITP
ncbi:hypothetical protein Ciccas_001874 [Cichlidogyrus casuarinus]|uniref:Peptidase M10 metallopeptidase domain-containing protein n=1 Tax=Cichlidogyrus casuarinus TaxID=1844966 RepID=A0ABD2QIY0_9PLAT